MSTAANQPGVFVAPAASAEVRVRTASIPWYIWVGVVAITSSSIGGAWAWTFATKRLPVVLSAQVITMETIFGTVFGLLMNHRWPTLAEFVGMTLLIVGVVIGIRIFHGHRDFALAPSTE